MLKFLKLNFKTFLKFITGSVKKTDEEKKILKDKQVERVVTMKDGSYDKEIVLP